MSRLAATKSIFFRRNGDFLKKSCPRDLPFLLLLLLLSKINARPGWLASRWMKEFLSHLVEESCFPVYSFKKRNGHVEAFSQLASLAKYRPFFKRNLNYSNLSRFLQLIRLLFIYNTGPQSTYRDSK